MPLPIVVFVLAEGILKKLDIFFVSDLISPHAEKAISCHHLI